MPTIKDIASLAGVSHGTVSNVLNKRGNVSSAKITLVESAARSLGYQINAQAQQLRQGSSNRIAVIIPKIQMKRYADLFEGINSSQKEPEFEVVLYCSDGYTYDEERILKNVAATNPLAVVLVSTICSNSDCFDDRTSYFFVEREPCKNSPNTWFVGFDYKKAGAALAEAAIAQNMKNLALFCGPKKYSNNSLFLKGCKSVLDPLDMKYTVYTSEDPLGLSTSFSIISDTQEFDGILIFGDENAHQIRIAAQYNPAIPLPHLFVLASSDTHIPTEQVSYILDYKQLGVRIEKLIKNNLHDLNSNHRVIVPEDRIKSPINAPNINTGNKSINVLILNSPTSKVLKYLLPRFAKQSGINVKLVDVPYDELYNTALQSKNSCAYDLFRLDMAWLSEMGPKIFQPMDFNKAPYNRIAASFSDNLPSEYFLTEGLSYSLPFDVSTQLMYYRRDLFSDAKLCRLFFEKYKEHLTVPTDFMLYNKCAQFFTRQYNPDSPTLYGTTTVLGNSVISAVELLVRLKAWGGSIFDEAQRVNVKTPAFRGALENYAEAYQYSSPSSKSWWNQAMQEFANGDTLMSIVYCNHATSILHGKDFDIFGKVGSAPVPGNQPLLGGGVLGISKNSNKISEIEIFLDWLYSEDTTSLITYLGGYINNKKLSHNMDIYKQYPWTRGLEESLSTGWRRMDTEKPGFNEFQFESIIGVSVQNYLQGLVSIDQAIDEIQKNCDEVFNH